MPENRLAKEKSPYLLQHKDNPVAWQAWGEEAFTQAKEENKPVFLSIGYSTCHWCHVMERESFESEEVATYLNEHFISIKVDREERPDVDRIYMTFVQAMSGQGGWPLNVFLTPDLKPFYGGTYWPPENKHGRPGFIQILQQVQHAWANRREEVTNSSKELHLKLTEFAQQQRPNDGSTDPGIVQEAGEKLKEGYDDINGGFGTAPKFPTPSLPAFLLTYGSRFKDQEAIEMVCHTCSKMADGGIYDQLGGGFARYSVDQAWLVPHFEKMLYDNAQLLNLYLDVIQLSDKPQFETIARGIIEYVQRDLTHPEGGIYSAEDADSEGKEGKFYCWTKKELSALLTVEEFNVATAYFGITDEGNFRDHSDPDPLPDLNVLRIANDEVREEDIGLLESARDKMFQQRDTRVRPHLDDKVLASWNGLYLGALARASAILNDKNYLKAAESNLDFLKSKLWDSQTSTLYHRWRDGEHDSVQLLDAYACLLNGVIELYQATIKPAHLQFAIELADAMITRFFDANDGGFWQSDTAATELILRMKNDYDGAEPSGNSVAIYSLLKLALITGRHDFNEKAIRSLQLFSGRLREIPQAVPHMLRAFDLSLEDPGRIVISGAPDHLATRELIVAAYSSYKPHRIVLGTEGPIESFAKSLQGDAAKAYVCTGTSCQAPITSPRDLANLLASTT